jgi:transposase
MDRLCATQKLPELGSVKAVELATVWREHTEALERQRLLVIKLMAQHELSAAQIAEAMGVGRSTLFRYLDKFIAGGIVGLLTREHKGGYVPTLQGHEREEFLKQLRQGRFRRAKEAQAWIKERPRKGSWPWAAFARSWE